MDSWTSTGERLALDEIRGWKDAGARVRVNGGSLIARCGDEETQAVPALARRVAA